MSEHLSSDGRAMTFTQFRLTWKREGNKPKHKKYRSMKPVNRMLTLLTSAEPWTATDENPDDYACCSGYGCGCGGETVRERMLKRREGLPPIEFIRVTKRTVTQTQWVPNE